MKKSFKSLLTIITMTMTSTFLIAASGNKELNIVPKPLSVTMGKGSFKISAKTKIFFSSDNQEFYNISSALEKHLNEFYSIGELQKKVSAQPKKGVIFFNLNKDAGLKEEAYILTVSRKGITIEASTFKGLFYGVQSLVQMMPVSEKSKKSVKVDCAKIEDSPRFAWRGLHLDVCRHFMPKEFVLKYLDYMAMHKFNTFHFHLTEDQGWRIEIKKYPKLTEIGSVRKETRIGKSDKYDGIEHKGYFTQEDIKEIVAYAAKLYITVVPEIEMPGHAMAALASYPELGCTGGPYEVITKWGVFNDVLCAGKESTFEFLQNVIDEIIPLFPGQYIHIGGDECPKTKWHECPLCQQRMVAENLKNEHELQSYFIQRMEKYINSKGRKIIGWDEILEGGLAPNAAVMSWRGIEGGIAAAKERHYVVMSPGSHCYLDHYQADPATEPLAIGGFTPLEKIYSYEPVPDALTQDEAQYIMGAQGNVWTEYILNPQHVEYMVYPRAAALSEVVWSSKDNRNYENFKNRMNNLIKFYDILGINYCKFEFEKK